MPAAVLRARCGGMQPRLRTRSRELRRPRPRRLWHEAPSAGGAEQHFHAPRAPRRGSEPSGRVGGPAPRRRVQATWPCLGMRPRSPGTPRSARGALRTPGARPRPVRPARRPRSAREFRCVPSFLFVSRFFENLTEPTQSREHSALDGAERLAQAGGQLGLGVAYVVGELDCLALLVGETLQRFLDARSLQAEPGLLVCSAPAGLG